MSTDPQPVLDVGLRRETALEVASAAKRYRDRVALDRTSFRVRPGEWVCLLGPNGAGKTTLMQAIAGLTELDGGSIDVLGQRLDRATKKKARTEIGFVPQEIALYPTLTARENLEVFGRLHDVRGVVLQRRIDWALDWCGLMHRAHDRVSTFSGGMKRRLNIACGVLHEPRIVLLDEPTVGVDPQARGRILEMLARLRDDGVALLHSTHALHEVEATGERVLILDRGRIVADGAVADLVAHQCDTPASFRLRVDRPVRHLPVRSEIRIQENEIRGKLHDVAEELPALLRMLREGGYEIHGLHVDTPGLEELFGQLTGRALRE